MNISENHTSEKEVSATPLFKGELGTTTAIQILPNGTLKEHVSKTAALLLCLSGHITFEAENEVNIQLSQGDYVFIEPNVKHKLTGHEKSQLILLK